MSIFEVHSILSDNRDLIAQTWNFFVSVHLAIFGVLLLSKGRMPIVMLVLTLPFYIGFMYLNYRAQVDNYTYASVLIDHAEVVAATLPNDEARLTKAVFQRGWVLQFLPLIYIGSFVLSMCILLLSVLQRRPAKEP